MTAPVHRGVRSYVLRSGRTTPAQQRAVDTLWPRFGVDPKPGDDVRTWFERDAPLVLDIGFGNGDSLLAAVQHDKACNYLGVEVHVAGIGAALRTLDTINAKHVRLFRGDAGDLLINHLPSASTAGVRLFFPDPWPKQRHHKRRIVQPEFVRLVASRLQRGGVFHLATDWAPYAAHMLSVLETIEEFRNEIAPYAIAARPQWRPETRFERRGYALGHVSHDLMYRRR